MASQLASGDLVSDRYASALYDLAAEKKLVDPVLGDLSNLKNVIIKIEESDINKSQINKAIFIDNENRHELAITIKSRVHSEEVLNLKKYWDLILS